MNELKLEQQFELRKLAEMAQAASKEQLEKAFIDVMRQSMIRENLYKQMLLKSAGIVAPMDEGMG
jgi:Phycobilisome degradation protein nblA